MENENYVSTSPDKNGSSHSNIEISNSSPDHGDGEVKMALTDPEEVKVKFTSNNHNLEGRNGEAKVDIGKLQVPYAGMSKEELMKFANDPFWVRLRWTLFIMFWLIWLIMLASAIIIIIYADRCPPEPTADWWHKSPIYNVFPRSFKDSDGDGVGDLKGVTSKLDYLKGIGVSTIVLNSIYKSTHVDFGNDILNHTEIDPLFGTMEDFKNLVAEVKNKDMKLVLDFLPTHTSSSHEWFQKSVRGEQDYEDFYIWHEGLGVGGRDVPNNWKSVYGGSAWTKNSIRNQFYHHDFFSQEPSLNLRNAAVQEELQKILQFWLNQGVDGFRVLSAGRLFKDKDFKSEPHIPNYVGESDDFDSLNHIYTSNLPEVLVLLSQWKQMINNHSSDDTYKILITEVHDTQAIALSYYGSNEETKPADLPMNFQLLKVNKTSTGQDVINLVRGWIRDKPVWAWSNWVLGANDRKRVSDRVDDELLDGLHMISMLVGGTPFTYYGEEIGMTDTDLTFDETLDPVGTKAGKLKYKQFSRDPERSPMQWSNSSHAGFTDGFRTWLKVNLNYQTVNVEHELAKPRSHLNIYKKLTALREQASILFGRQDFPSDLSQDIFCVYRVKKGKPGYAILVNFGKMKHAVDLTLGTTTGMGYDIPENGYVQVCTANIPSTSPLNCDAARSKISLNNIPLGPSEGVVLKFVPSFP